MPPAAPRKRKISAIDHPFPMRFWITQELRIAPPPNPITARPVTAPLLFGNQDVEVDRGTT
jgi:hypothetical protein